MDEIDLDEWDVGANDADKRRIGSNIRYMRQEKGLSQQDLARAMKERGQTHWHQTTVSRVERGTQEVNLGELRALEQVLGSGLMFGTRTDASMRGVGIQVERTLALRQLRKVHEALVESEKVVRYLRALYQDPQLDDESQDQADALSGFEEAFDVNLNRDQVEVLDDRTSPPEESRADRLKKSIARRKAATAKPSTTRVRVQTDVQKDRAKKE